jgi:hypothetical protein
MKNIQKEQVHSRAKKEPAQLVPETKVRVD